MNIWTKLFAEFEHLFLTRVKTKNFMPLFLYMEFNHLKDRATWWREFTFYH